MSLQQKVYDIIGVGIGPFNLGLAAMMEETGGKEVLFFEQKSEFNWHKGMLIEGTTLQVPFFADLISMANVQSRFTYLHYLQSHNRLYHFYFLEKFHIPRKEYNDYCRWVADQMPSCQFGFQVEEIKPINDFYEVIVKNVQTNETEAYHTRHVAVGIGTSPSVPSHLVKHLGSNVLHSSQYMDRKRELQQAESITVIGSGQSAAEIFYDLLQEQDNGAYELNWFTRSKGFFPMEYSKLGLEYFSPDYIDFFYQLPQEKKDSLLSKQDLLYKGISMDTIADIYNLLYDKTACGEKLPIHLLAMTELAGLEQRNGTNLLTLRHCVSEETFELESDFIILGTGYAPSIPHFLHQMQDVIEWDEKGRFKVTRDYTLQTKSMKDNKIFIQNGELHTHGVGAPDLGLGAYRNAVIMNQIYGREIYPVKKKNVFQSFTADESWKTAAVR
ncbi:lysine N(6)-hydroxylase/L-ornithine N(5)-oxygenase family protein [Cytobacillus oceanisediminis]|uniref:lysine N(6)-hydroxylase/L-ornithine N(5)-oxygenase family protein n=1 Tax=Cytobacillus oceanisediminis TaxID=665099 RepID=UPI001C22D8C2|nr:lysine N(6)-hydroxylase/L-ornithine N(5)-oxygenase family protein [Cytobacillus oceanisediminis]MBU8769185.1 lysine N(6)-hydroxylase/L-ornithine N(5)-oxygenase family protein [Cytobacillus oceanisediminis]